jgi:predicted PurR-regulated permease PerM
MRPTALTWIAGLLTLAAVITLAPLWVPLVLGVWSAHLCGGIARRLTRIVGNRRPVAAAVTIGLLLVVLVPFGLAVASLVVSGVELIRKLSTSDQLQSALQSLVSDSGEAGGNVSIGALLDPRHLVSLAREHGVQAWALAKTFAGASADFAVQLFVYLLTTYAVLANGEEMWTWVVERAPLEPRVLERFRGAFHETGRGLIIGNGGTALAQALVAFIAYAALGVPRALILAQMTFFASFIPSFGTALVWVPVAGGLVFTGAYGKAAILVAVGILVIGTIDNVMRPVFARWGNLELPVFIQIISIFGGFVVFGAWGFLLGPLIFRLAKEALDIHRDDRRQVTPT